MASSFSQPTGLDARNSASRDFDMPSSLSQGAASVRLRTITVTSLMPHVSGILSAMTGSEPVQATLVQEHALGDAARLTAARAAATFGRAA
eukprot:1271118-Alexandrium_andersonii.AAC.1